MTKDDKARRIRGVLYALLACAALARLLLQIAAMPPYAGLDEIYHVARLAFVLQEERNPTTRERSIPPYLEGSIQQKHDALPAFGVVASRWPEVVKTNPIVVSERPLTPADLRPYQRPNYEAQQASPYYTIAAPFGTAILPRTAVSELRIWRFLSVILAVMIIIASAIAAERWFGPAGIVAAALIASFPTWLTLVARAGNDALACALVAAGIAISSSQPVRVRGALVEAAVWAAAVATKLYAWPVLIVPGVMWIQQRTSRTRVAIVIAACTTAAMATLFDLRSRTANLLGVVAFDRPGGEKFAAGVDFGEIVRVTIASAAWTSGEHWNAMTPLAIAICFGPLLAVCASALWTAAARPRFRPQIVLTTIALITFAAAQFFNVISCVLARRAGNPVPIGGKEGWYWYVLAPIVIPLLLSPALKRKTGVALAVWIVGWDVIVHECMLFHDYAGSTSPADPTLLFRWGPLYPPFSVSLSGIGVGPLTDHLIALRAVHLVALTALLGFATIFARKLNHDRDSAQS